MEGMTTEHGPLVLYGVKEAGVMFSGKLSRNPYSWNNQAHVLYVDQPRYVGYSVGAGPFVKSSLEAGHDMVTFLRGWRHLFPEHAHRGLILAAESYGGHYIPAWASAILDYNAHASDPLNLVGLAIGNGIVNETVQGATFPEFARRQGLIPKSEILQSSWGAREIMKNYLGYIPNYYDYRLAEQECCGCSSYNYKPWSDWLLREDVTRALNVCGNAGTKAFGDCAAGCINMPEFDRADAFSYSGALGRALDHGVHVTLYYGMQDTACNYVGGYAMASTIEWSGADLFAQMPLEDLMIGGVPTGKFKAAAGLAWVQIENAGHMVPINSPAAASFAIGTLIPGSGAARFVAGRSISALGRAFDAHLVRWLPQLGGRGVPQRGQWAVLGLLCGCSSLALFAAARACPRGSPLALGDTGCSQRRISATWGLLEADEPSAQHCGTDPERATASLSE